MIKAVIALVMITIAVSIIRKIVICPQCGKRKLKLINGICISCKNQNVRDQQYIINLVKAGHTQHCAHRLILGDGECECGVEGDYTNWRS